MHVLLSIILSEGGVRFHWAIYIVTTVASFEIKLAVMPIQATQHLLSFLPQQYQRDCVKSLSILQCTPVPNFLPYVSFLFLPASC